MASQKLFFRRTLLVFGGLALGGLIAEGALRLAGLQPERPHVTRIGREAIRRPAPGLAYLYEPYTSFTEQWPSDPHGYLGEDRSITYQVNNAGFRGEDFGLEHPGGTRVAILGDSFAWGTGVRSEDLASARIEQVLRSSAGVEGPADVYNFGLAGYNTANELALLEHTVLDYDPDVCVLWYFLNDLGGVSTLNSLGGNDRLRSWREHSALLDLLVRPVDRWLGQRRLTERYLEDYAEGSPLLDDLRRRIFWFSWLCRQHDVVPLLVIHPVLTTLDDEHPFAGIHELIRGLAAERDIETVDLLPVFLGQDAERLWVHPTDQHPNHRAHRMAGEAVGEALVELLTTPEAR